MNLRFPASFAVISALASALACSAAGDGGSETEGSGNNGSGASSSTGNQPSLGGSSVGTGNQPSLGGSVTANPLPMDPNDPRDVPVRPKICDAAGNCTCLRLALVGTLESAATAKDTKPFIDWLNANSDGTATVTMVTTKPAIDDAFLGMYDILVVANVNGWTFSADEKAAVEKWVKEMGGGIVTLTGFNSMATEPAATSQLIDFAGMGYTGAAEADWTAPHAGNVTPIYYNGGAVDLRNCLNLWSNPVDKEAANTTAIKFTPQTGALENLTASLTYVGAYIGWPVKAPTGSTVLATDPMSGKNMAVAYEIDGKGRILSFGDEWIVFTNQWQPLGNFTDARMDANNMCWQATPDPGFFHSVKSLYQTKQFWYNAINWVAPPSECNFTITDDDVVVK
jgi:hypothetical protein